MPFYAPERLGEKQRLTPEGFLVCLDVPIARTGEQHYADHELPEAKPGPDGVIYVDRPGDVVFDPATMASFEGKPVTFNPRTLGHPPGFVLPGNIDEHQVGHVQNVRRGEDELADLLIADLFITDPEAIEAIRDGLREVSCGYDADYEQTVAGQVRTTSITGNHVALVKKGRAGPRVAIGDQAHMPTETKIKRGSLAARLRALLKDAESEAAEVLGEVTDPEMLTNPLGEQTVRIIVEAPPGTGTPATAEPDATVATDDEGDDMTAKFAALEARVTALEALVKPTGDADGDDDKKDDEDGKDKPFGDADEDDKKDKDEDKAITADAFTDVLAQAEILSPGFRRPTVDGAASRTVGAANAVRREVLASALKGNKADALKTLGITDAKTITNDALPAIFGAAVALVGASNNSVRRPTVAMIAPSASRVTSPRALNEANRAYYGRA